MDSQTNRQTLLNTPLHGVQLLDPKQTKNHLQNAYPFQLDITISQNQPIKPNSKPIWSLSDKGERYHSLLELFKVDDLFLLNIECEGTGSFTYKQNQVEVNWQQQGTQFEHYFQSIGIACWLEQKNIPCIHANAISYQGNAYLIIAPSRTGKSTLTTYLTGQGFKLMTDDMAAIYPKKDGQFVVYPSWPKVRLWPDSANALLGPEIESNSSTNKCEQTLDTKRPEKSQPESILANQQSLFTAAKRKHVHQKFAKFEIDLDTELNKVWQTAPTGIKAIYVLQREQTKTSDCNITAVAPSAGLMLLLQNSILANAYTGLGLESERLQTLAQITEAIPVFNLNYSSGLDNLPKVGRTLKEHINEAL